MVHKKGCYMFCFLQHWPSFLKHVELNRTVPDADESKGFKEDQYQSYLKQWHQSLDNTHCSNFFDSGGLAAAQFWKCLTINVTIMIMWWCGVEALISCDEKWPSIFKSKIMAECPGIKCWCRDNIYNSAWCPRCPHHSTYHTFQAFHMSPNSSAE